jgi:RNA polymerase sigma factor (sigma-70 family)
MAAPIAPPVYPDEALVAAVRSGDDRALERLYRQHYPMVAQLVRTNSGSDDEAKDIYQEAVIVFYEKAKQPSFVLTCQVKTYLYAVSRRLWLKRLAERNRFATPFADTETWPPEGAAVAETPRDERWALGQEERYHSMEAALHQLGEPCRSLLEGFYLREQSMTDLMHEHGYANTDTAKTQKYKCLGRLRKLFFATWRPDEHDED